MTRFKFDTKDLGWRGIVVVITVVSLILAGAIWCLREKLEPRRPIVYSPGEDERTPIFAMPSDDHVDENVAKMMGLKQVEGVVLRGAGVKRKHIETLSNHPSLKLLVLSDTLLNDVDLGLSDGSAIEVQFCDQKSLKVLQEMRARVDRPWGKGPLMNGRYPEVARALVRVSGLTEVERVDMRNCVTSREALESCSGFKGLKYLFVGYGFDDSMVDLLLPLKGVEQLDLSQSMVTDQAMNQIVQMPSLKILTLGPNMGDESMSVLAKCKTLEVVHCGFSQVGDAGVAALASSPTVRGLDLSGRPISKQSFDAFANFAKLQELAFSDCVNVEYDDYKKLANIRALKRLDAPLPESIRDSLQHSIPGIQASVGLKIGG